MVTRLATAAGDDIRAALERVRARCDIEARRAADPVGVVHRYEDPLDRELVGLLASCVAFGNVKTIRQKLEDALARLGPSPSTLANDRARTRARLRGWSHRVFRGDDIAALLVGARRVQKESGSLGRRFAAEMATHGELRPALSAWCDAIRRAGGLGEGGDKKRRGPSHLLPNPMGSSGCKRLLLFLRWMVRPADGVDLGLWTDYVGPEILLCPVDTHIHKLSRNLGFTRRKDLTWKTTEEITRALAAFDPHDPAKYDFALCHMGMLQRCPSRRDVRRCEGCGVKPVCRHWVGYSGRAPIPSTQSSPV